jgi:hypothetical protein
MSALTEAEAKKKLCHISMASWDETCRASECMAWRWAQKRNPAWKGRGWSASATPTHPEDEPPMYVEDRKRGYCGLAGRP